MQAEEAARCIVVVSRCGLFRTQSEQPAVVIAAWHVKAMVATHVNPFHSSSKAVCTSFTSGKDSIVVFCGCLVMEVVFM